MFTPDIEQQPILENEEGDRLLDLADKIGVEIADGGA
jgi:hypothetical protein